VRAPLWLPELDAGSLARTTGQQLTCQVPTGRGSRKGEVESAFTGGNQPAYSARAGGVRQAKEATTVRRPLAADCRSPERGRERRSNTRWSAL